MILGNISAVALHRATSLAFTHAGQGVPASVVAATAPGELQGEKGSDSR